jgi:hypothetical protein
MEFTWSLRASPSERDTSKEDDQVALQRVINQEGRMRPDRFQLLEDTDFVWEVDSFDPEASLRQRQWDEMYQHLVEFKETNGHPNVPFSFSQWGLGAWVHTQRKKARSGGMEDQRLQRMMEIGLTWDVHDEQWEEIFTRLEAFKMKYGHCKVRRGDGRLGEWVNRQRVIYKNGKLKPTRETRLKAVGFAWDASEDGSSSSLASSPEANETISSVPHVDCKRKSSQDTEIDVNGNQKRAKTA